MEPESFFEKRTNRPVLVKGGLKRNGFIAGFLLIFLISFRQDSPYDFRSVYLKDLSEIHEDHEMLMNNNAAIFRQFFNPPLSKFSYSSRTIGRSSIQTWIRRNGDLRKIRILKCAIAIDTTEEVTDIQTGMVVERIPVKGTFRFKVYIFDKQSSPRSLIYTTCRGSGLQYFLIDGKPDGPSREFIDLGIGGALKKLREEAFKAFGIRI